MYKLHYDNFLINEHDDDDEAQIRPRRQYGQRFNGTVPESLRVHCKSFMTATATVFQ